MTLTTILAVIAAVVIILSEAARVPGALAALIRACIPLVEAVHHLRAALAQRDGGTRPDSQLPDHPAR